MRRASSIGNRFSRDCVLAGQVLVGAGALYAWTQMHAHLLSDRLFGAAILTWGFAAIAAPIGIWRLKPWGYRLEAVVALPFLGMIPLDVCRDFQRHSPSLGNYVFACIIGFHIFKWMMRCLQSAATLARNPAEAS